MSEPGYKYLSCFMLSTIIYDLTVEFTNIYFSERKDLRIKEQMDHAARSGRQNIAEGYSQTTSLKGYIKLLGVAKGSLEELRLDFQDYLRQRDLELWEKEHPRIREFRAFRVFWVTSNILNSPISLIDKRNPIEFSNLMITLISQAMYLLDRLIRVLEEKFIREGGYTEKLFRLRTNSR